MLQLSKSGFVFRLTSLMAILALNVFSPFNASSAQAACDSSYTLSGSKTVADMLEWSGGSFQAGSNRGGIGKKAVKPQRLIEELTVALGTPAHTDHVAKGWKIIGDCTLASSAKAATGEPVTYFSQPNRVCFALPKENSSADSFRIGYWSEDNGRWVLFRGPKSHWVQFFDGDNTAYGCVGSYLPGTFVLLGVNK